MGLNAALMGLAFTAGMLGFLSPCALPMLPSYVAYYLNRGEGASTGRRLLWALVFAFATIAGFLTVFTSLGLLPSIAIRLAPLSATILVPVIGLGLIALGLLTAAGSLLRVPHLGIAPPSASGLLSFYLYGVAYAFASLSCSLPVFLLVVFQSATAESPLHTLLLFLFYGLGAGALMVPVTVATSFSKGYMHRRLMSIMPHMRKLSAVILIAAGAYMILVPQ